MKIERAVSLINLLDFQLEADQGTTLVKWKHTEKGKRRKEQKIIF